MKIRRLSDEELKKCIKKYFIKGSVYLILGTLCILFSIKNYWYGFIGILMILVGITHFIFLMHERTILEIRHQKNNEVKP